MKVGASQLCSYRSSLLSGRKNCIIGTIRSVTCSSIKSAPNLPYKLSQNYITAYVLADRIDPEYSTNDNTFSMPLWGHASICGDTRQQQQDVVVAIPQFLNAATTTAAPLTRLAGAPFFGVYDGHGGSQVANYCGDRLHSALAEELEVIVANLNDKRKDFLPNLAGYEEIGEEEWRKALARCFRKVDAELETKDVVGPHVSPEPIGSTAVVAIVCPSYIVVANCGDSRAVLKRDQESIPLSVDYKTAREDEYARIEAAGGNILKWHPRYGDRRVIVDDHFASIYLRVPRAIGDRRWKPWVIPDPEVTLFPRTEGDKCLILASDGLWDVTTNAEACDIADKMIRGRYGHLLHTGRLDGLEESASRAAAECLAHRALEKGSRGNISVLVVDLESLP